MNQTVMQDHEPGRAAVRLHLMGRLDEAGLTRAKGVTVEAHKLMTERLVVHLAYMTPANLMTLAEVLMGVAGQARGVWPSEVLVRQMAHGLQRPPFGDQRICFSWLASVEGPRAVEAGFVVELFRFLRVTQRPPFPGEVRAMLRDSEDNHRQRARIRERIAQGRHTAAEAEWLRDYDADRDEAQAIVAAGDARRSAA